MKTEGECAVRMETKGSETHGCEEAEGGAEKKNATPQILAAVRAHNL
jgi:hypothetical protein